MPYFRQSLQGLGHPPSPTAEPLTGLQAMRRPPMDAAMRSQDRIVTQSRRIVLVNGLVGSNDWWAPASLVASNSGGSPPDSPNNITGLSHTVAESRAELTPGCILRLDVLCLPSSAWYSSFLSEGGYENTPSVGGRIDVLITWYDQDGGNEVSAHSLWLPSSQNVDGSIDTDGGAAWNQIQSRTQLLEPPGDFTDDAVINRWSRQVTVDIEVQYRMSPRVVDLVISEVPWAVAYFHTDDPDFWCSHILSTGSPSGQATRWDFPMEEVSAGNPRNGSEQCSEVALAQAKRLNPMLWTWSAWDEESADGDAPVPILTVPSDTPYTTGFFDVFDDGLQASQDNPGFAVSTAGLARRWNENSYIALRDRVAVVPVIFRVYAAKTAGTGSIRFQTGPDSYVTVDVSSATPSWLEASGWLEVGINPSQPRVGQLLFFGSASGTLQLHYASVELHDPNIVPGYLS